VAVGTRAGLQRVGGPVARVATHRGRRADTVHGDARAGSERRARRQAPGAHGARGPRRGAPHVRPRRPTARGDGRGLDAAGADGGQALARARLRPGRAVGGAGGGDGRDARSGGVPRRARRARRARDRLPQHARERRGQRAHPAGVGPRGRRAGDERDPPAARREGLRRGRRDGHPGGGVDSFLPLSSALGQTNACMHELLGYLRG
jgi:hypothetical protein